MKNTNYPLFIGSIILILLILMSFYPRIFTSHDPLFEERPKYIEYKRDGELVEKWAQNPMPPNKENILGTDDAGRDVYARIIYGTRNTLKIAVLVAVFRMLIALPLGLAAGMGIGFISGVIRIFNTYFTAIPMLLFSFVVLNIGYFRMLQMDKSIIAFAIVLTIVGWAKLAGMIEDSTKRVMEEDFIEGEIAIGKTKFQIAYQNVLPHIISDGISLFFKEMGMSLFLVAQLAVLYVFVGVTRQTKELAFRADYDMILEPEWGGALSRIAVNIKGYDSVYWLILYPLLAFSISIIGINLLGEGIRMEFQKRDSRFISIIRKAYYQVSPKLFISQIKNFKKYYKPVLIKLLIIVVVTGYFIIPWNPSLYEFQLDEAKIHLQELTKDKYEGRVSGTKGGHLSGEYIINVLESYGYEIDTMDIPLTREVELADSQEKIMFPEIIAPTTIDTGWIKLIDNEGKEKTYYLHEDFTIASVNKNIFMDNSKKTVEYKGIAVDMENLDKISEDVDFFLINQGVYLHEHYFSNPNQILAPTGKKLGYDLEFALFGEEFNTHINPYLYKSTTIIPFYELREDLETGYREIEISFDYPKVAEYPGRNIMAFLPGKNRTREEPGELLIIGCSYDGVYTKDEGTHAMTSAPVAIALEVARKLSELEEPLEKSIEFIFWDNEFETIKHSSLSGSNYYCLTEQRDIDMALTHGYYYFDISYPGYTWDKSLNLIAFPSQSADKSNYLLSLEIEKRLKNINSKYQRFHYDMVNSKAILQMRLNALTSVGLGNPSTFGINSQMDNLDNINYERMKEIGQIIIDTMTMNPHIME